MGDEGKLSLREVQQDQARRAAHSSFHDFPYCSKACIFVSGALDSQTHSSENTPYRYNSPQCSRDVHAAAYAASRLLLAP